VAGVRPALSPSRERPSGRLHEGSGNRPSRQMITEPTRTASCPRGLTESGLQANSGSLHSFVYLTIHGMMDQSAPDGLSAHGICLWVIPRKGDLTVLETRNYELMLVVSPELDGEALDAVLQRVQRYLEAAEARVVSFKSWGLRRLAYTLKGQREGRYYLVLFTADSLAISDLDRSIRLVEGVLRHLMTRMETEMPEPTEEEPRKAAPEPVEEATPEPTPEPVEEATPESAPEPVEEVTPEPTTEPEGDSPSDSE